MAGFAKCVHEAQRAWHEVAPAAWLDTRIHKYAFASALTEAPYRAGADTDVTALRAAARAWLRAVL